MRKGVFKHRPRSGVAPIMHVIALWRRLFFPFVWVPGANRPSAGPGHPATGAGTGSATRRGQRHPLRGSCRAPLRAPQRPRAHGAGAGWARLAHPARPRPRARGAGAASRAPLRARGRASAGDNATSATAGPPAGQRHSHRASTAPPGTTPPAGQQGAGAPRYGHVQRHQTGTTPPAQGCAGARIGPGGWGHGEPYRAQFLQCAGQTSSRRRVPDKGSKRQAGGMQKKQRWEGSVIHKRVNKFHHVINLLFVPTLFPLCSRFVPVS